MCNMVKTFGSFLAYFAIAGCSTADSDLQFDTASAAQAVTTIDQCTPNERDDWDKRLGACTGQWTYSTYECFKPGRVPACGVSHFEKKPVIGTLSCERPDQGAVAWTLVQTMDRKIKYKELPRHEEFVRQEAIRMYGNQALGAYRIADWDVARVQRITAANALILTNRIQHHELPAPCSYTEVFYYMKEDGDWVWQATNQQTTSRQRTMLTQHESMVTATNIPKGFATVIWHNSTCLNFSLAKDSFSWEREHGELIVQEEYYKPTHYPVEPHPECGQGEIGQIDDDTKPIYDECRHVDNGREERNDCGAPETPHVSSFNVRRDELPSEHAYARNSAICSTGDALDDVNATPSARFSAFQAVAEGRSGNADGILAADVASEQVKRLALKKLKYLYERNSAALTAEQRAAMPMIYQQTPQINACGTSCVSADDASEDPAFLGLVERCYRLSLDHVSVLNAKDEMRGCWTPEASSAMGADGQFYLRRLGDASYRMLEKYISLAAQEHLPLCEGGATDAIDMIDAWYHAAQTEYGNGKAMVLRTQLIEQLSKQCW